jgi:hypothetical protein
LSTAFKKNEKESSSLMQDTLSKLLLSAVTIMRDKLLIPDAHIARERSLLTAAISPGNFYQDGND